MKADKYIYQYANNVIAKFYCNKRPIQKVFTGKDAVKKAIAWRDEKLAELNKVGRFRVGLNKHGLPVGIIEYVERLKGRKPRRVFKITGGIVNGKHRQTSVGIASRGYAKALKLAIEKRMSFLRDRSNSNSRLPV